MDASGYGAGQKGGKVKILGKNIRVKSTTTVDVSGDMGGGEILVGGNYQGTGSEQHALTNYVEKGATFYADAVTSGNGGKVVVWSDGMTLFYGNIFARGGFFSGNGGQAETSGHYLDITGARVNLLALSGKTGTWLLDPTDLTISNSATANASFSTDTYTGDNNSDTSNVNIAELVSALDNADITVQTTGGGTGIGNGDITVVDPITWTSTQTLTLNAFRNIVINAGITATDGGLVLNAANSSQSITTGASGTIDVGHFNIVQGQWYQVGTLPSFSATNFQLNSGGGQTPTVQFIRATSGDGSSGTPYVLADIYGVQGIGSNSTTLGYSYSLGNDIDASGTSQWNSGSGFVPIGIDTGAFLGNFNGQNHIIDNLFIDRSNEHYVALFGYADLTDYGLGAGTIQNIGLTNISVIGGGVADQGIGALVGLVVNGTISNAYSTGSILLPAGGVCSSNCGTGGLIGQASGTTVTGSHSSATVTNLSASTGSIGGLAGFLSGTLSDSYATGDVFSASDGGGLVGFLSGTASRIYASGNVTATNSNAGGLASFSDATITDAYSVGKVIGGSLNVGGLIARFTGSLSNSYSSGQVSSGYGATVGGLIGDNAGTVTNSFWDTTTSGQSNAVGSGSSSGITAGTFDGSSGSNLSAQATYNGAGWDISNTVSTNATAPSNTWFVFEGSTRPMLMMEYSTNVTNAHQLQLVGTTLGGTYTLANDVDLSRGMTNAAEVWGTNFNTSTGIGFKPIGLASFDNGNPFSGSFDGNNHVISNLYIGNFSSADLSDTGLFASISGSVSNLGLTSANINVLTGNNGGDMGVGTIAGSLRSGGTLSNVYSTGSVTVSANTLTRVGGLLGFNAGGSISDSYSLANVSNTLTAGNPVSATGGFVGQSSNGTINRSYSGGSVTGIMQSGTTHLLGGFAGQNDTGAINNSYSYGSVTATGAGTNIIGGFIGQGSNGTVTNSYSSGAVTAPGGATVGGFMAATSGGTSTNNFWDTDTSGQASSVAGTGRTTAQMMDFNTFDGAGWSITSTPGAVATWFIIDGFTRPLLEMEYNTIIRNAHQLQLMAFDLGANYTLANNIDASGTHNAADVWGTTTLNGGAGFVPVGDGSSHFTGTLNGQNYTINDLYINSSAAYAGLIGYSDGNISNIGITNANVITTGESFGGILLGRLDNLATVDNAYATGTMTTSSNTGANAGTGGLIGQNFSGLVSNSHFSGTVTGTDSDNIGGLIGSAPSGADNSYSTGTVSGRNNVGGLIGVIDGGRVTNTYSSSNVSGVTNVGGLAGSLISGLISNNYSTGSISGTTNVGGHIGSVSGFAASSLSYSTGAVSGTTHVGGFIGFADIDSLGSNNYWDTATSGQATGIGLDSSGGSISAPTAGTFDGSSGVNLSQMASYSGWDIGNTLSLGTTAPSNTWFIFEGSTRPMLMSEYSTTITNAHQLQLAGSTLGANYTLANNIDLSSGMTNAAEIWGTNSNLASGAGFMPIGNFNTSSSFVGSFNGNNHTISGLYINQPSGNYVGLFGSAGNAAVIWDIGILSGTISGNQNTGALLGLNNGLVFNVFSNAAVNGVGTAPNLIGGLIGQNTDGIVSNSYSTGTVTAGNGALGVGGFVGVNVNGTISSSFSSSTVISGTGSNGVGGFIGINVAGQIANAYSLGSVTAGAGSTGVGGFAGGNSDQINNVYSIGNVVGGSGSTSVGGLVGQNDSSITNSFWDTSTSGQASGAGSGDATGITAGTFDGSSGVNLSEAATYTGAGWDLTSTWSIIEDKAYPYLAYFYSGGTPRAISGTITGDTGGSTVQIAANGANISTSGVVQGTATTGANGFYYFLQPNGAIADASTILTYLTSGGTANAITIAPDSGDGITGLNTATNTVSVGDSSSQSLSNAILVAAKGTLIDANILYSVSGNNLTFTANKNFQTTGTTDYDISGNLDVSGGTGNITFNGSSISGSNNVLLGSGNLTINISADSLFNGVISGSGGLIKAGSAILTLSGANTYTGTTAINAGTLQLGAADVISDSSAVILADVSGAIFDLNNNNETIASLSGGGASGGNVTLGSGTLTTGNSNNTTYNGVISGTGGVTKQGSGIFTLGGANAYTGTTAINAGTLQLGAADVISDSSAVILADVSGAIFDLNNNDETIASLSGGGISGGNVTLGSGTLTTGDSSNTTYNGVISGTGGVTKQGSGTFTLGGTNTFGDISHHFTISAGQVTATSSSALGSSSTTTDVSDGAALAINGSGLNISNLITLSGSGIGGTGALVDISTPGAGNTLGSNGIVLNADSTIGVTTSGEILSIGSTSGAYNLTKVGSGALYLSSNSFGNGGTTFNINEGEVRAFANSSLGNSSQAVAVASGAVLTLDGALNINNSLSIAGTGISSGGALVSTSGSSTIQALALSADASINTASGLTVAGTLSGAHSLTKIGSSVLTLSGNNTFGSGSTMNINAGDVVISTSTGLGDATNNVIVGASSGGLHITGNGLDIANNMTLNGSGNSGALNDFSGGGSANTVSGNITLGSDSTVNVNNGSTLTLSGVISGAHHLVKEGGSTLVLSNTGNTYGTTTISAGTIRSGATNALSTNALEMIGGTFDMNGFAQQVANLSGSSTITNSGSATTFTVNNASDNTFSGLISDGLGSIALTKINTGALTLSNSNTYSGATTLTAGTLIAGNSTNPFGTGVLNLNGGTLSASTGTTLGNSSFTIGNGATATVGGSNNIIFSNAGSFGNSGSSLAITNTGGTITLGGVLSGAGSVTQSGSGGTLVFNSANTYSGATTLNAGTLQQGVADVMSNSNAVTLGGGTFDLNDFDSSINTLSGTSGTISLGTGTLTVTQGSDQTFAGVISGSGGLTKAGSSRLTLSNNNTYTGTTDITAGTLQNGIANALAPTSTLNVAALATYDLNGFNQELGDFGSDTGTITSATPATLTVNTSNFAPIGFNGSLTGSLSLEKLGSGTFFLNDGGGNSSYTGTTHIGEGVLIAYTSTALGTGSAGISVDDGGTLMIDTATFANTSTITLNGLGAIGVGALYLTNSSQTLNNLITLNSDTSILATNATLGGVISGAGALTKTGPGTLVLSGTNTYSGGTSIENGTLSISSNANLGATPGSPTAGNIVFSGGTLETTANFTLSANRGILLNSTGNFLVDTGTTLTYGGVINGTGGLTKQGLGNLTLSGSNIYSGPTTLTAGGLIANNTTNPFGTGVLNLNGGTLSAQTNTVLGNSSYTIGSGAAATIGGLFSITLSNNGSFGDSSSSLTTTNTGGTIILNGGLSGAGSVIRNGAGGGLRFVGQNTYTGTTTITAGTLIMGAANAMSSSSDVSLANAANASLNLNNFSQTIGNLSGGGNLGGNILLGTGTLTVTEAGNTTYSGTISSTTGGLTKTGAGTLTLGHSNNYNGATTISNGTLRIGANGAIRFTSAVDISSGGTLDLNDISLSVASIAGAGNINFGSLGSGALAYVGNGSTTFSGIISGTGTLDKQGSGTLTLSGANNYTGQTIITAGTLRLGASDVIPDSSPINLANTAGATFDLNGFSETIGTLVGGGTTGGNISLGAGTLTVTQNSNQTYAGVISDLGLGGSLIKLGSSTLTLSGHNTYTGTTTVNAGTLRNGIADALPTSGMLTVNSPAIYDLNGFDQTLAGAEANGTITNSDPVVPATLSVGNNTTDSAFSGTISGNIALTKINSQPFSLLGNNSYTGATHVIGGDLYIFGVNSLGNTSSILVDNGAALNLFPLDGTTITNTATITLNGSGISNGGALTLWNNAIASNAIILASDSTISTLSNAALNGGVSGAFALDLTGSGSLALGNTVNVGSLSASNTGGLTVNTTNITSSGTQTYDTGVTLGNNATFTTTSGNIALNNGLSGGANTLLLIGSGNNIFSLSGVLSSGGITITGGGTAGNTLAVNSGAAQTWNIGANTLAGSNITGGANFSGIQTLNGGNNGNSFVFADGASMNTINGGSSSNTINYSAYSTPLTVALSSISGSGVSAGTTTGTGGGAANFTGIGNMLVNQSVNHNLTIPTKSNALTFDSSSPVGGGINDPFLFSGFGNFTVGSGGSGSLTFNVPYSQVSANQYIVNGVLLTFNGNFFLVTPIPPAPPTPPPPSPTPTISNTQINAILSLGTLMGSSTGGLSPIQNQPSQTDNASSASSSLVDSVFSNATVSSDITIIENNQQTIEVQQKDKQKFKVCPPVKS